MTVFYKTTADVLDYTIDWDDNWLASGETISTSDWAIYAENRESPVNLIEDSESSTSSRATIWVSSGTVGARYRLRNTIVTSASRTGRRTIYLEISHDIPDP